MLYYNIHGIVKIACNVEGFFPEYFRTGKTGNVDLEIIEGDFRRPKTKKFGLFYGDKKTVYFESSFYGKPVYKAMVQNLSGSTKIRFTKITRKVFNVQKLAFIILQIKLLQKGYSLIHAGAVSKDGKGKIMFGWPGVGKSSTIFGLSKTESFKVLGDDAIIISKTGKIYSYPQSLGVFYKSENVGRLRLPIHKKFELLFRYIVCNIPPFNRYVGCKLMVDMSKVVNVSKSAPIDKFYFLETGTGRTVIKKDRAINKIIASTLQSFFDHYLSNKMFYGYCFITGFDPGYIEKNMRKLLERVVKKSPTVIMSDKKDFYKYFI